MRIRTVRVEFLRHGPANNQLLSRITPYLAMCGDHSAETVSVPLDHRDFLLEQRILRYEDAQTVRAAHLERAGRMIAGLLEQVRGLDTEIGCNRHDGDMIHLELVLSAAELAMLPFEAARTPRGILGAGSELLLQADLPVTMTRAVRRVSRRLRWDHGSPRILIVLASPATVPQVPDLAHVAAIHKAVAPWIRPASPGRPQGAAAMITVLQNATLSALRDACASNAYSHVHILAHGKAIQEVGGERFALVFHPERGQGAERLVDGDLLLTALRTRPLSGSSELTRPAVVSIAACDSGNVGSVILPGASLAHALHQGGISLVVTSQFPLSYPGSVAMTETLYAGLMRGLDPRLVLHDVRRSLRGLGDLTHDWASVVAYADFAPDMSGQVARATRERATDAAGAVLARTDAQAAGQAMLPDWENELNEAIAWLKESLPEGDDPDTRWQQGEIYGRLASIEKRRAHLLDKQERADKRKEALHEALKYYQAGLERCSWSHWLAVQCVSLTTVLEDDGQQKAKQVELLKSGRGVAELASRHADPRERAWAYATLAEVVLLEAALADPAPLGTLASGREYLQKMIQAVGPTAFHVISTRRQMRRYQIWWKEKLPQLSELAKSLAEALPGIGEDPIDVAATQ